MNKKSQKKKDKAKLGGKPGQHVQPPSIVPGGQGHGAAFDPNQPPAYRPYSQPGRQAGPHDSFAYTQQPPPTGSKGHGGIPGSGTSQSGPMLPPPVPYRQHVPPPSVHQFPRFSSQAGAPPDSFAYTQQPPPTGSKGHGGIPGYGTRQSGPMLPPPAPYSQHVPPPSTHQFPRFPSQAGAPPVGPRGNFQPKQNLNTNKSQPTGMGMRKGSGHASGQTQEMRQNVEKDRDRDKISSKKIYLGKDHRGRGRRHGRRGQSGRKKDSTDEKNSRASSECGNEENDEREDFSDSENTDTETAEETKPKSHEFKMSTDSLNKDKTGKKNNMNDSGNQTAREPTEPPEEKKVFEYLIKKVRGPISVKDIAAEKLFPEGFDIPGWFRSHQRFIMFENTEKNYQFIIPFFKEAKFCFDYNHLGRQEKCDQSDCPHAHICKNFIDGHCKQGEKCSFSHNFNDRANASLILKMGLNIFSNEEIRLIYSLRFPHVCGRHTPTNICRLPACAYLHICISNLFGKCEKGFDCKLSHTFETEQNKNVIKAYQLAHWSEPEIKKVIFHRPFSSKGNREPKDNSPHGSKDSLSDKRDISQNSLNREGSTSSIKKGYRKSSTSPTPESHNKDSASKTNSFNMEQTGSKMKKGKESRKEDMDVQEVKIHELDKTSMDSVLGTDEAMSTPICDLYLVDSCRTATCKYHHLDSIKLPYIWQIQMFTSWLTLNMQEIIETEKAFCNKKNTYQTKIIYEGCNYSATLDLNNMTAVVRNSGSSGFTINTCARRLSTKSYATGAKPSAEDNFQTQWRWFYMEDFEICCLFEPGLLQFTLEQKFAKKCQNTYLYSCENYKVKYCIDFKSMEQKNIETGVAQKLLRRPLFVSAEDVINKHYPEKIDVPTGVKVPLPVGWVPWDLAHPFELVELKQTSAEFKKIKRSFMATLNQKEFHIITILRVQNMELWMAYDGQKKSMKISLERAGQTKEVDERGLFHGTDSLDTVQGICTNSFDFRLCGKHGSALGKGAYFARDAKYSHKYTNSSSSTAIRYMFLAKVLVGEFTTGSANYVRPPEKPDGTSHLLFDSCVDNVDSPALFVVFDLKQCYPEYLICYKSFEEFHVEEETLITLTDNTTHSLVEQIQPLSILDQPNEPTLDVSLRSLPIVEKDSILTMFDPLYGLDPNLSFTDSSNDNVSSHPKNLPFSSFQRSTDVSSSQMVYLTQGHGVEDIESRVKPVGNASAQQELCCVQ